MGVACLGLLPPPLSAQGPRLRATLKGHANLVGSGAFSPDGKTLASGGGGYAGEVMLWDVPPAKEAGR